MPQTNLTPERLAELKALHEKATPGPWSTDWAYLIASVPNGRPGGENIGMFVERPRQDLVPFEENCKLTAALHNTFPAIALELQRLWAAQRAMGRVLLCSACGGTGKLPGGTDEYPASGCCPIGHAKECSCHLCLWRRAGYAKDARIAALEAELTTAKQSLGEAFVAGAKWWESLTTNGTMWQGDQRAAEAEAERRGYDFKPSIEKALEEQLAQVQRELEAARAKARFNERAVEDSKRLMWLEAHLNMGKMGEITPFLTSAVMQDVLLRCPPMGTEFPHLRAAIDAARAEPRV